MKEPTAPTLRKSLFRRREPFAFMLGLGIIGIGLMFLAFLLVYLIRKSGDDWGSFELPKVFNLSTAVILASSFTLHYANVYVRKDNFRAFRLMLGSTLVLGGLFCFLQILGWMQLQNQGIYLKSIVSAGFLYVISGIHLLHIAGGLVFLAFAFGQALRHAAYIDSFVYHVNPPNQLKLQLITRYWHFVDGLWLFLFLFFLYQHS
jgi:cytochrome c oxidase subunit 3